MPARSKPRISVVIPAYNEANFLPRCLDSLQQQTNAPMYEIIVVDNASTDNTADIAKSFGVKVIYESKKGVVNAREAGRQAAHGEIIVSTDADSFFKSNWLHNISEFYYKHPDASGLAGHYLFYKGPVWSVVFPTMGAVLVWLVSIFCHKAIYASAANLSFLAGTLDAYETKYYQGGDERGVIMQIQKKGRVYVTLNNIVYTSSRRINQGFWHSILVTIGYYYSYNAFKTKKHGVSKIGSLPPIRDERRLAHWRIILLQWLILIILGLAIIWYVYA